MNIITNILYWISTGLLVPVIVLLILFFVRALLMMGGFFGQYLTVKRVNVRLNEKIKSLDADGLDEFCGSLPVKGASLVEDYLRQVIASRGNEARIELLVSEYEIEADKQLSTSKVMTKMGPILGLMGTLIPMGPALVGLSTGDIASMAYNMQVAFATTVVGMVISAIGFVTQQFKERWLVRDMAILEYVARLVTENR
jgi:biopolymer transport protein ExbB/TolQ